jgi:hypothetical protein
MGASSAVGEKKLKFMERDVLFHLALALRSRDSGFDTGQEVPTFTFGNNVAHTCVTSSLFETVQIQYCKHDYRHCVVQAGYHSGNFDAVNVGHRQIQQDQVGFQFLKFPNTRPAILSLPAYSPVTGAHDGVQDTPRGLGVIDD